MSTFADLIRAHERNPRALYRPEVSERVSAPGHYEQTASQRSPALDRRIEKQLARKLGEDLGLDPDDLDKIDDFEDLNDLLNGEDPDLPDPEEPDFPEPEEPDLPDPEDPETPDIPLDPPTGLPGLTAYALHSGSISRSEDGGATWARHTGSPADPIGFSVSTQGVFVATSTAVHFSPDLRQWRELAIQGDVNLQIEGFVNGSFEGGMGGWETISGDSPRTGSTAPAIPTDGDSYLMRDWIIFTGGEFEVAQDVSLTAAEIAAIGSGALSFSGDVFGNGGTAELRIERQIETNEPYFRSDDYIAGALFSSDALTVCSISATGLSTSTVSAAIAFYHEIDTAGTGWDSRFQFRMRLTRSDGSSAIFQHPMEIDDNRPSKADLRDIRDGVFVRAFTLTLTSSSVAGTIILEIPEGFSYPIDVVDGPVERVSTSNTGYSSIGFGVGWDTLASASGSDYTWNRITANVSSVPSTDIRCVIKGTGSPADVYIDNCRLEIVRTADALEVTAIGGDYVAINSALYRMSPDGLAFDRALEFDPTGIVEDGSLAWGGGYIFVRDEDATYNLPQTVVKAFAGGILLMSGGEIWRRDNDPDYPGWDTIGAPGSVADIAGIGGGWIAIGAGSSEEEGFVKTSSNLATWITVSPRSHGCDRIFGSAMKIFAYKRGSSGLLWFDTSGWHLAGNLKAGILDISA